MSSLKNKLSDILMKTQKVFLGARSFHLVWILGVLSLSFCITQELVVAAGGKLKLLVDDEATGEPASARLELRRGDENRRLVPVRRAVSTGGGLIIDRSLDISLPDGPYTFRVTRGPEYRVVNGSFSLEPTSEDEHQIRLPRMIDMLSQGWTSGDACLPASPISLPLRMSAEDLHVAGVLGHLEANPIAGRKRDEQPCCSPFWIREDVIHDRGLVFYGKNLPVPKATKPVVAALARYARKGSNPEADTFKVAIENPFAWPLPVWLASKRIDGFFLLGDWLHPGRRIMTVKEGRSPTGPNTDDPTQVGRWAETIYWNLLEAGFRIPPLAGSGDSGKSIPVGYNRMYVANPQPLDERYRESTDIGQALSSIANEKQFWNLAWLGHSVMTNGPMLQPTLNQTIPGHVFDLSDGDSIVLQPEIQLSVRDPVDYLDVVCNGSVFYSARLDEFAKAGGRIPAMTIDKSSWILMRVITQHEEHYRVAISAPWYVDVSGNRRITKHGVTFFQDWLEAYEEKLKKQPRDQLTDHVPFVRAARKFWNERASRADKL